jgi:hypothetical protein
MRAALCVRMMAGFASTLWRHCRRRLAPDDEPAREAINERRRHLRTDEVEERRVLEAPACEPVK